jgi:hypothetical protein
MTGKPTTAHPVTGKRVTGRKPKPVMLADVKCIRLWPFLGQTKTKPTECRRFTVCRDYKPHPNYTGNLVVTTRNYPVWAVRTRFYAVWDKQRHEWLYPNPRWLNPRWLRISRKQYRTRAEAWDYLRTTTTTNRAYRLEMLNRALDRNKDAA